jgi:hypothetical protein
MLGNENEFLFIHRPIQSPRIDLEIIYDFDGLRLLVSRRFAGHGLERQAM